MKNNIFIWYPKCSTWQKAKKWLENNQVKFQERHIVDEVPTEKELKEWIQKGKYPIKKFFNTSGLKYKELNLKEKLLTMKEEEQIKLLASNGMLIKRPILVSEDIILVGFKEKEWEEAFKTKWK